MAGTGGIVNDVVYVADEVHPLFRRSAIRDRAEGLMDNDFRPGKRSVADID